MQNRQNELISLPVTTRVVLTSITNINQPVETSVKKSKTVQVVKGTGIAYDPAQHAGQEIETITQTAFRQRQAVQVVKGTGIAYDPAQHAGQERETITQAAFKDRQAVQVVKGTGIVYDPAQYAGQEMETITQTPFNMRKRKRKSTSNTTIELPVATSSISSTAAAAASIASISASPAAFFFQPPVVKLEKAEKSIEEMIDAMRALIKSKRDGNNADSNCGFLTEYSILALVNMLQGKEARAQSIRTEPSFLHNRVRNSESLCSH